MLNAARNTYITACYSSFEDYIAVDYIPSIHGISYYGIVFSVMVIDRYYDYHTNRDSARGMALTRNRFPEEARLRESDTAGELPRVGRSHD